ncbi:MAG: hypothetical protein AB7E95_01190 [Kiritimatiellales bacterium]
MRKGMMLISYLSLAAVVAAPILFCAGAISLDAVKIILNTATVTWFASALCWVGRETGSEG